MKFAAPRRASLWLATRLKHAIARGMMIADGISSVLRGVDHRQNRRYVRCQWQAFTRSAMFATKQLRKHALECLRLQADCMELAGIAQGHDVQAHFLHMAEFWGALAVSRPGSSVGLELSKAE
jgi:hypothetical protein